MFECMLRIAKEIISKLLLESTLQFPGGLQSTLREIFKIVKIGLLLDVVCFIPIHFDIL